MLILLDTNIVIEHLNKGLLQDVDPEIRFAVSTVTEAELLRLSGISDKEDEIIRDFLSITKSLPVDSAIARKAGVLGRTRKTKMSDLLIAATALETQIPIMTRNTKDFKNIPGIEIYKVE